MSERSTVNTLVPGSAPAVVGSKPGSVLIVARAGFGFVTADATSSGTHVCTNVMSFDSAMRAIVGFCCRNTTLNAPAIAVVSMPIKSTLISSSGRVKPASRRRSVRCCVPAFVDAEVVVLMSFSRSSGL